MSCIKTRSTTEGEVIASPLLTISEFRAFRSALSRSCDAEQYINYKRRFAPASLRLPISFLEENPPRFLLISWRLFVVIVAAVIVLIVIGVKTIQPFTRHCHILFIHHSNRQRQRFHYLHLELQARLPPPSPSSSVAPYQVL